MSVVVVVDNLGFVESRKEIKEDLKEPKEENKKETMNSIFEDFGNQIEFDEDDLAF